MKKSKTQQLPEVDDRTMVVCRINERKQTQALARWMTAKERRHQGLTKR